MGRSSPGRGRRSGSGGVRGRGHHQVLRTGPELTSLPRTLDETPALSVRTTERAAHLGGQPLEANDDHGKRPPAGSPRVTGAMPSSNPGCQSQLSGAMHATGCRALRESRRQQSQRSSSWCVRRSLTGHERARLSHRRRAAENPICGQVLGGRSCAFFELCAVGECLVSFGSGCVRITQKPSVQNSCRTGFVATGVALARGDVDDTS